MKQLLTALLCIGFTGFISCQKEMSQDSARRTDSPDTLLSKIIVHDTINPGKDITYIEFVYDNQDRVSEIKEIYLDSTGGSITIHEQYSTYFYYNGADRRPFKSYGWTRYIYQEYEVFHYYDAMGRLRLDSLGAPDQSHLLNNFQYAQNKLVITSSIYDENKVLTDQVSDSFYINNGNVTSAFLWFPMTAQDENAFEYTYDDKINPLSKLNIAPCLGFDKFTPMAKFWMLPFGESRNNIIKRLGYTDYPAGTPYVREYRFTYNDHNLPVSGSFLVDGKDDEGIRILYEYTH